MVRLCVGAQEDTETHRHGHLPDLHFRGRPPHKARNSLGLLVLYSISRPPFLAVTWDKSCEACCCDELPFSLNCRRCSQLCPLDQSRSDFPRDGISASPVGRRESLARSQETAGHVLTERGRLISSHLSPPPSRVLLSATVTSNCLHHETRPPEDRTP